MTKRQWLFVVVVTMLVVVLNVACGSSIVTPTTNPGQRPNSSSLVDEVILSDGTRCAVLIGEDWGAIDCDWR